MSRVPRRDRWSLKKWYRVLAPPIFNFVEVGEVPALDPSYLLNRTLEVTLYDLTGDITKLHIKLKFQIVYVEGDTAYTQFKGMELARDYIRSLVRRGTSKVDGYFDVYTADGHHLRVASLVITAHRAKKSQERAIRKVAREIIEEWAANNTFYDFIKKAVFGDLANAIMEKARKIYPLKASEIMKIKVFSAPPITKETLTQGTAAAQEAKESEAAAPTA